jgi:hypothetical protein
MPLGRPKPKSENSETTTLSRRLTLYLRHRNLTSPAPLWPLSSPLSLTLSSSGSLGLLALLALPVLPPPLAHAGAPGPAVRLARGLRAKPLTGIRQLASGE